MATNADIRARDRISCGMTDSDDLLMPTILRVRATSNGLSFGAEESGDLLGEGEELRVGLRENFVIVAEALAPNPLNDWEEVLCGKSIGRPAPNDSENLFSFAVVLIGGTANREKTFRVGIADEFLDGDRKSVV